MRAILIDPEKRTINEIQLHPKGDNDISIYHEALGCRSFENGSRPLNGSMMEGHDTLYVDARSAFFVDTNDEATAADRMRQRHRFVGVDLEPIARLAIERALAPRAFSFSW